MKFGFNVMLLYGVSLFSSFTIMDKPTADLSRAVIKDVVPPDFNYFYLLDTAYSKGLHQIITEDKKVLHYLDSMYPDFNGISENDYILDSTHILWSDYDLPKAITLPNSSFDTIFSDSRVIICVDPKLYARQMDSFKRAARWNEIYAPLKIGWRKKKRNEVLNIYSDSLESLIPKERGLCFQISKPEFTKDRKYAIIEVGNGDSNTVYIYQHKDETWKRLCDIFVWY